MYRIILAVNAANTHKNIINRINWNAHGFDLAGIYENDKDIAEVVKNRYADAIIADVKVSAQNGPDIKQQACGRNLCLKVIFPTEDQGGNGIHPATCYRSYEYTIEPINSRRIGEFLDRLRAGLDVRHASKITNGQMLIAEYILSQPDSAPAILKLRKDVLRAVKMLDKNDAIHALDSFITSLKQSELSNGVIAAWLNNLGLCLMEYAAEQRIDIKENICGLLSEHIEPDSTYECMKRYLIDLIEDNERLIDKSGRYGSLAVEYINTHYMKANLSIKDMTSFLSVSSSYFSVMFKNYTGVTFTDFLARRRIDKARKLLLTTDKKNYEIAADVGYDDPGYFGYIFRKYTNLNPSEFRKMNAKKLS